MTLKKIVSLMSFVKLAIVLVFLVSKSVSAEYLNFFSPQDDVNYHIIRAINGSSSSIDMTALDIRSGDISNALISAHKRGVNIRVLFTVKGAIPGNLQVKNIVINNIKAWVLEEKDMHIGNYAVFDKKLLLSGDFMFDNGKYQSITFSNDMELVRQYCERFEGFANLKLSEAKKVISMAGANSSWGGAGSGHFESQQQVVDIPMPAHTGQGPNAQPLQYSFDEMYRLFGRNSTLGRSEKKRLWKEYKGKIVTWTGKISYIAWGLITGDIIGVKHTGNNEVIVQIKESFVPHVKGMHKGDTITYRGRLSKRPKKFNGFKIEDAEILKR